MADIIISFKIRGYDGPLKPEAVYSLYCWVHYGQGMQHILVGQIWTSPTTLPTDLAVWLYVFK